MSLVHAVNKKQLGTVQILYLFTTHVTAENCLNGCQIFGRFGF